ncbi:MAG TPA: rod shape-determining protein MreD [Gammaproteobacteria bacterium]|nr:rod shape-determining protein MreD [Gammaproteobacteria bacterium]
MIGILPYHLLVIITSFVAALMITLLPLPNALAPLRPDWLALVLIYWVIALPHRVGVGSGWLVGLFQDAATGTLLGQHALGLAVVAWLVQGLHHRIRNYPLWQQAILVLVVIALFRVLGAWVLGVSGRPTGFDYWLPAVSSMLVWPLVYLVLRYVRRRFGVQ